MEDEESRTVWVGNFDPEVTTEETLYELFLQAGPLHYVKIPRDKTTKRSKNFGFICFRHSVSVPYAIELLNDIDVNGRNLRVQSRNHQQLQKQGQASGPGGIHSLDPSFGVAQNFSGPSQPCGQQALMQTPSLLGLPNQTIMAMAQQQMALLNAYQPIPLAANPLLNAPKERYSDRHGSISHDRNNQYMKHNSPRNNSYQQQGNYSRNSPYQRNNYSNDYGKHSSYHQNASAGTGRFDFNRLGPQQNRDHQQHHHHNHYRSSHSNDNHSRHGGQHNRHRSDSYHNKYDNHRNSGRHYDNRNYR